MKRTRVWFSAKGLALLMLGLLLVTGCASSRSNRSTGSGSCPSCN
jgi:hypothetical protein